MNTEKKSDLRKAMREKRNLLSRKEQLSAARKLLFKFSKHKLFKRAKSIGFYFANDGEISVEPLFRLALNQNKSCYLPCVLPNNRMEFRKFVSDKKLRKNAHGIWEPSKFCSNIRAQDLDLVFAPLVAWNYQGERLGMGGGYYDRCFAFKRKHAALKPVLVGTAHRCQHAENICADSWDIAMDIILCDLGLVQIKRR